MSPTPRTDEQLVDAFRDTLRSGKSYVHAEFTRQLERELAAAKAEIERLKISAPPASAYGAYTKVGG